MRITPADLDALEAALAKYGDHTPLDIKFHLPAWADAFFAVRSRLDPERLARYARC
jgi:hypothetical protein